MSDGSPILVRPQGDVVLSLHRPERGNAIDRAMVESRESMAAFLHRGWKLARGAPRSLGARSGEGGQRPKAAVTSSVSRYSVICFTFPSPMRNTRQ